MHVQLYVYLRCFEGGGFIPSGIYEIGIEEGRGITAWRPFIEILI